MSGRYDDILQTIGRTPVVRINRLGPSRVNLYAKLEAFNPMGSVKDRLALGVIEDAEAAGALKPGQTVVEATSGNTGIGLAMVCARKGYPLVVTMAENFSVERRRMMRFLGAKVVLTPAAEKGSGMLAKAVELAETHGWFLCRQFENEANADMHSRTTAVEILEDFADTGLDYWVTGFGTGGTLKGVARVLRERSPDTRVVVCEPDNSAMLASGVAQAHAADGRPSASHPSFRPHLMQGWSPDFIPKLTEDAVEAGLFEDIPIDMTDEELAISRSTPRFRFDAPPPPPAKPGAPAEQPPAVDAAAADFVAEALDDADNPVVMFALEWCEFCWSVRRMFADYRIGYRSVDLDSVEYQKGDLGGRIREALAARTGWKTIPQIFVAGEFVGGCTDVFDAWRDGRLQQLLDRHGVAHTGAERADPYSFLPTWLHPR